MSCYTLDGSDPADGGALTFGLPIPITESIQIRTRVQSDSEWSALNEATFIVPALPDLRISEIMYHPAPPNLAEIAAGFSDQDDFEFLEIHNRSLNPVELEGFQFTDGVSFTFPQYELPPGGRVMIVSNLSAYTMRYGVSSTVIGTYSPGKLSNGGERVRLEPALGEVIAEVTYDDQSPWPETADGAGFPLVFVDDPGSEFSSPTSWRASALPGGSAGSEDTVTFSEWISFHLPAAPAPETAALADPDGDGLSNTIEYAFDLNPGVPDAQKMPGLERADSDTSIIYEKALYKTDLMITPETSTDLQIWSQEAMVEEILPGAAGIEKTKVTLNTDQTTLLFRFVITL